MKAKLKFFKGEILSNFNLLQLELRKIPTRWVLFWAWLQKRAGICVGKILKIALDWKRSTSYFKQQKT